MLSPTISPEKTLDEAEGLDDWMKAAFMRRQSKVMEAMAA
jgi:hypothetical protein